MSKSLKAAASTIEASGHPGSFEAAETLSYVSEESEDTYRRLCIIDQDQFGQLLTEADEENTGISRTTWIISPVYGDDEKWSIHFFSAPGASGMWITDFNSTEE